MISLKRTYKTARGRIGEIAESLPADEAFVLTMFFVEKILRRVLLQLVILKGMNPNDALEVVKRLTGIWKVKDAWPCYDPKNRILETIIGQPTWDTIKDAAKKRNELVHGSGNEGQKVYRKALPRIIAALDEIKLTFEAEYGFGGWRGMMDSTGKKI